MPTSEDAYNYHDPATRAAPKLKVDVEVYLEREADHELIIREYETSRPFSIPRSGITIKNRRGKVVTLRLSERKAVEYNLV
jgi:hypothetical protein